MLIQADARRIPLADGSVQCVTTSPPYWSLRDYGLEPSVFGGDAECEHAWGAEIPGDPRGGSGPNAKEAYAGDGKTTYARQAPRGNYCSLCGAWRGCLGLEPTPELYVAHIVEVFREVRRVIRDDGTCWLNLGDSYAGSGKGRMGDGTCVGGEKQQTNWGSVHGNMPTRYEGAGLKPKDLVGIPWRVAFALQADGWWLRDAIIWAKGWVDDEDVNEGSVMPGSQQDRCTSAYEMVFMLTKKARYYFDIDGQRTTSGATMRNVWRINTASFKGAHFATFAPKLAERCILLGTSTRGACPECGAGWERTVDAEPYQPRGDHRKYAGESGHNNPAGKTPGSNTRGMPDRHKHTTGWCSTCDCGRDDVRPCLVLDPFAGSATTGMVAIQHGRDFVGLDLNGDYLRNLATERLSKIQKVLL